MPQFKSYFSLLEKKQLFRAGVLALFVYTAICFYLSAIAAELKGYKNDFEAPFKPLTSIDHSNIKAVISGFLPENWYNNSSWAQVEAEYFQSTNDPYQGKSALGINVKNVIKGSVLTAVQPVFLGSKTFIKIKFAARSSTGNQTIIELFTNPYKRYWRKEIELLPEWKTCEFIIPPFAEENDNGFFVFYMLSPGRLEIDEFSLEYFSEEEITPKEINLSGNLLPNSSFPDHLTGAWCLDAKSMYSKAVTDEKETGPSGVPALRLEPVFSFEQGSPYLCLCSPGISYAGGHSYTFSFYAKAESGEENVKIFFGPPEYISKFQKTIELSGTWKRYAVTQELPFAENNLLIIKFQLLNKKVWIDGLQFETGNKMSEFIRSDKTEIGLRTIKPYGLHFREEALEYCVSIICDTNMKIVLKGSIYDMYGKTHLLDPLSAVVNGLYKKNIYVNNSSLPALGTYRIEYRAYDENNLPVSKYAEALVHRIEHPRMEEKNAPESPFGIHVTATEDQVLMAKSLGFNWVRPHSPANEWTKWFFIEKNKDEWDFSECDRSVALMKKYNIMIYGMLDTAPAFYSFCPQGFTGFWQKYWYPSDIAAFGAYCKKMAERYRNDIKLWEIWNEPYVLNYLPMPDNSQKSGKIHAGPVKYTELVKTAYSAVKKASPTSKIIWMGNREDTWTKECIENGIATHADQMSVHIYTAAPAGYKGDYIEDRMCFLSNQLNNHSFDVYNSEGAIGAQLFNSYNHIPPFSDNQRMENLNSAGKLVRLYISQLAGGINKFFLYTFHQWAAWYPTVSMLTPDGKLPPGAAALSAMMWHIEGKKFIDRIELKQNIFLYLFNGTNESTGIILGRPGSSVQLQMETNGIIIKDMFGNIPGRIFEAGPYPVYLSGSAISADIIKKCIINQ